MHSWNVQQNFVFKDGFATMVDTIELVALSLLLNIACVRALLHRNDSSKINDAI